jgi:hypothetical protein
MAKRCAFNTLDHSSSLCTSTGDIMGQKVLATRDIVINVGKEPQAWGTPGNDRWNATGYTNGWLSFSAEIPVWNAKYKDTIDGEVLTAKSKPLEIPVIPTIDLSAKPIKRTKTRFGHHRVKSSSETKKRERQNKKVGRR